MASTWAFCAFPAMSWRVDKSGDPLLKMDGQAVFKLAVGCWKRLPMQRCQGWFDEPDIDWLIPHQANIRIMQGTARKLKLSMDKVVVTVDQHLGNTSAASIPLALDHACAMVRSSPGQTGAAGGVGGGFTWGRAALKM